MLQQITNRDTAKLMNPEQPPPNESPGYADSITTYLGAESEESILRPHQVSVFEDVERFFAAGERRGYINLPTGTGKTVLFVELTKALRDFGESDTKPRVLVVAPTRDLVRQTLGRDGERGFGKFAPELSTGSYFTDTDSTERQAFLDFDVVVSTYSSFMKLSQEWLQKPVLDFEQDVRQSQEYRQAEELYGKDMARLMYAGRQLMPSGTRLIDTFDVVILDEAHHALGERASHIVNTLAPECVVMGFSATPDASANRRLTSVLPHCIHELGLREAIEDLGLLAPVVPIGLRSGLRVHRSDIYDEHGELIDTRIAYLAEDSQRNQLILNAARVLAEQKIGTIIPCIAGNKAQHARYLAERLTTMGVSAAAVYADMPLQTREAIYKQFDEGNIDVLTSVGLLSEGWDSARAKGLINARPTRSETISKQRLGRIVRPGATAFAIDICDEFDELNGPINVADVLESGDITLGQAVGTPDTAGQVQRIIQELEHHTQAIMGSLPSVYHEQAALRAGLDTLHRGHTYNAEGKPTGYATVSTWQANYRGLTEEIITRYQEIHDCDIRRKTAARGTAIQTVFNSRDVNEMLHAIPLAEPARYHIDTVGNKWIASQGLARLFSKRYSHVTEEIIEYVIETSGQALNWVPVKYDTTSEASDFRHYKLAKMYSADSAAIADMNALLADYFDRA